jgi:hypothetical protein
LPELAAPQGQLTAQSAPDAEDPVPEVPASITPPGSLNGSAPSSGEDG